MPGESTNSTTMWTPNRGFDSAWAGGGQTSAFGQNTGAPAANPWMVNDATGNATQDAGATGTPTRTTNTGANGLTTTGVMNPFGLVWNQSQNAGFVPGAGGGAGATPATPATPAVPGTSPAQPAQPAQPNTLGGAANVVQGFAPDNMLAPPDQRGQTGTFNADTGRTDYGQYSMDASGNWFGADGQPVEFNQHIMGTGDQNFQDPAKSLYDPAVDSQYQALGWTKDPATGTWGPGNSAAATGTGNVTYNHDAGTAPAQTPQGSGGGGGTPAGFQTPDYMKGVTSANPLGGTNAANPMQFATDATSNNIASMFGGTTRKDQLQGPGYGWSTPQNLVGFKNGNTINPGLAANEMQKYGSTPGSYGRYLVDRDVSGNYGPSPWDTKVNAPQVAQQYTQDVSNQQQADQGGQQQQQVMQLLQQIFGQGQGQGQGYQSSQGQQPMSNMGGLLNLLQQLGLFGQGNKGATGGMNPYQNFRPPYQRPPAFAQNSGNYPYYSKFA